MKSLDLVGEDMVELSFSVPDLRRLPVIGGGCCAIPAEFLIEEALKELEQAPTGGTGINGSATAITS